MKPVLLKGSVLADRIFSSLKLEVEALRKKTGRAPCLTSVRIGANFSAELYEKAQKKRADAIGVEYRGYHLGPHATQEGVERLIRRLNQDKTVNGILIQAPLPKQLDPKRTIYAIEPEKDVEGIHPENLGKAILGKEDYGSCTAIAVMELLKGHRVALYGKEAVIVGSSDVVGKPTSMMLVDAFATTTVCHIATTERGNLEQHVRRAEILVVAVGKPHLIKGEWIRRGAVVVDVGINQYQGRIVGDVEFEKALRRASFITPVPGGVGPLVPAVLMRQLVENFKKHLKHPS
ncbi:MAG: bifunctional 5,10-methylenetetrahydrofolate dehydrogenase/5,10-methenyltetrahydrofolate cyclohydrolase [Candidatus Omnitrophota bacterium]